MDVGGKGERRVKNTTSEWTHITKGDGVNIKRRVSRGSWTSSALIILSLGVCEDTDLGKSMQLIIRLRCVGR